MPIRLSLVLCGTLCVAGLASAQPAFDCAHSSSAVEDLICGNPDLSALDRRLADRYAAALWQARAVDAGAEAAQRTLRAEQRGWIKGRNDCWKAEDMAACVADSYLMREAELVALWMLEEPRAIRNYSCEGSPASEVTVHFFDTERPAIRVEYGDGIRAGWRVPAGSGGKYETTFGGSFWEKGDEALFEWTEGRSMRCRADR